MPHIEFSGYYQDSRRISRIYIKKRASNSCNLDIPKKVSTSRYRDPISNAVLKSILNWNTHASQVLMFHSCILHTLRKTIFNFHSLITTHFWGFIFHISIHTTHSSHFDTHYCLLLIHFSLLTPCFYFFTFYFSLLTFHCFILLTALSLLLTSDAWLFTPHFPPIIPHYSLFTHHS